MVRWSVQSIQQSPGGAEGTAHHGARSRNEFYREIQQSKTLLIMYHSAELLQEKHSSWDAGEVP